MTVFFEVLGSFFSVEFWPSVTLRVSRNDPCEGRWTLCHAPWRTQGSMSICCSHLSLWLCSPTGLRTPWDQGSIKTDYCWALNEHSFKKQIPVCRVTYLKDPNLQWKLSTSTYGHARPWGHSRWRDVLQNSDVHPDALGCSPKAFLLSISQSLVRRPVASEAPNTTPYLLNGPRFTWGY